MPARQDDDLWFEGPGDRSFAITTTGSATEPVLGRSALPPDAVEVGWACPVADVALGRAVHHQLAPGQRCVTSRLRIDWATPALAATASPLRVEATVRERDPRHLLAQGNVHGTDGDLVATCTGRFTVLPDATALTAIRATGTPPVSGDLGEHLGFVPTVTSDATDRTWTISTDSRFANPFGVMHGGIQAALFSSLAGATALEPARPVRLLDLTVDYLRPARIEFGTLAINAQVRRRSRSLAEVRMRLADPAGAVLSVASSLLAARG